MSLLSAAGGAGDIWSTGAFSFESPLKDLLDSGEYSTEDLLAQDELLQELRGLHPTLTQYFGTEQVVTQLLRYVVLGPKDSPPSAKMTNNFVPSQALTDEPEEESNKDDNKNNSGTTDLPPGDWLFRYLEKKSNGDTKPATTDDPVLVRVRFPYMACEILCCELPSTIDTLVEGYVVNDEDSEISSKSSEPQQVINASVTDDSVEVSATTPSTTRPRLLDLLFSVLHETPPGALDDYRAGYLDKILTVLFRRRPEVMTEYMNTGGQYGLDSSQRALLQHLYSYSVTQITQRLLLPPRPKPVASNNPSNENTETPEQAGQDILGGEDPDDEDVDPDMNGAGIKCDWYKSKHAVHWLLQLLQGVSIGERKSVMTEEQRLATSMNASEVFITVIQNSMLSSDTMLTLTTVDVWKQLISAVLPATEDTAFSSHESFQTSAMNVIESLVLQLGGYGAVGTMSLLPEEDTPEEAAQDQAHELIADLENLLDVLPILLKGFATLLTHPSTRDWRSKMQFSQHAPVALLGMSRLKIVRVLESLVLLGDPDVDHKLVESDCLRICLDLFWKFQWCSMLHQSVANLLVHVFEGQNVRYEIQEYFLVQCNLLGRLMDSFGKAEHVIEQAKAAAPPPSPSEDSLTDPLPVSEDDVDAAMEVSTTADESKTDDTGTVAQSFRYGYMGHVIIICQALVQACTNDWGGENSGMEEGSAFAGGGTLSTQLSQQNPQTGFPTSSGDSTVKTGDTSEMEPLMIAELVKNHELTGQWKDFVSTSLSVEITVQSTPLGGYPGPSTDPLAPHRPGIDAPPVSVAPQIGGRRPGLADDDMDMGTAASQPPPPRGMLGGGEPIDMDDTDLDVAAAMFGDLTLGRPNTTATAVDDSDSDSGQFSGSGDSEKSYNSGETNISGGGYMFDDPLGSSGGLGIELGKLTKLGLGGGTKKKKPPTPEEPPLLKSKAPQEEKDDEDSHSSSDEEPPRPDSDDDGDNSNGDENDDDDNVPVMDLWAGNFNHGQSSPGDDKPGTDSKDEAEFGAFANFDAFAGSPPPPTHTEEETNASAAPSLDVFAKAPPPDLVDFVETPAAPADDDAFGDFVSAEPATSEEVTAGSGSAISPDPFDVDSAFDAGFDPFAESSNKADSIDVFPSAEDAVGTDFLTVSTPGADDFPSSNVFKTTFTGNSFGDMDELKPAPSDELAADAAATSVPESAPSAQEAPSDGSPSEEGVLVSSS